MKLFDLHCDTPYRLRSRKQHLLENNLHISLEKVKVYENYGQGRAQYAPNTKKTTQRHSSVFARYLITFSPSLI